MFNIKLGSLFDGIGGFPFVAELLGITPVWSSEIEPLCVAVLKERFPKMKHLGDINNIKGSEIEPVDIITFGSPCQDLSIAGNRKGLDGERSNLFLEATRIWYVDNPIRYKSPLTLESIGVNRAPQNWHYVDVDVDVDKDGV